MTFAHALSLAPDYFDQLLGKTITYIHLQAAHLRPALCGIYLALSTCNKTDDRLA
jgi:hypothetical protein